MPSKRPREGKSGRGFSGKSSAGKNRRTSDKTDKRSRKPADEKTYTRSKEKKQVKTREAGHERFREENSFGGRNKKRADENGYDRKKSGKSFGSRDKKYAGDKSYDRKKSEKTFGDRDKKYDDRKSVGFSRKDKPFSKKENEWDYREKSGKSFGDRDKKYGDKKSAGFDRQEKSFGDRNKKYGDKSFDRKDKPFGKKEGEWNDRKKKDSSHEDFGGKRAYRKNYTSSYGKEEHEDELNEASQYTEKKRTFEKKKGEYERLIKRSEKNIGKTEKKDDGLIRLNKYLANSGVASRRDADRLIESGAVTVNGVVVTQLGTKIKPTDKVQYGGQSVKTERMVYILLNKPKDYITTMDDPQGRKTVMSLIRGAVKERVYPVGRLDRNTTGVLLFTNDGELTRRLTHPKFLVSKMYHVTLDKNFSKEHMEQMRKGLELEDGFIKPDQLEYSGETKKELGIEIHSGRNRIVRRMFEHLGYDVVKLDRVQFAGLSKKDIPRGKYRFLSEKEVGFLKML